MNAAVAQFQQQMQALEASAHQQLAWMVISVVALNILTWVILFFIARWFLLHVFEIQQKRFFTRLDIFLHQRGIAPHIPETKATLPAQQAHFRDAPPKPGEDRSQRYGGGTGQPDCEGPHSAGEGTGHGPHAPGAGLGGFEPWDEGGRGTRR